MTTHNLNVKTKMVDVGTPELALPVADEEGDVLTVHEETAVGYHSKPNRVYWQIKLPP